MKLALFKDLPSLRWRPKEDQQIVPREAQANGAALAEDFDVLERELMPHFRELDNEALRWQNQFRLDQLLLIFGGTLAAALGAVQAAMNGLSWFGIAEALLASALGIVALRARAQRAQEHYFTNRLKAETLRGEYFLFLGQIGPYADVDRLRRLIRRVADVKIGDEGSGHGRA